MPSSAYASCRPPTATEQFSPGVLGDDERPRGIRGAVHQCTASRLPLPTGNSRVFSPPYPARIFFGGETSGGGNIRLQVLGVKKFYSPAARSERKKQRKEFALTRHERRRSLRVKKSAPLFRKTTTKYTLWEKWKAGGKKCGVGKHPVGGGTFSNYR